jgi:hypothetical protein
MARTQLKKIRLAVNDGFSEALRLAVANKFRRLRVQTQWNFFAMVSVTTRVDGKPFTREQATFLRGFEDGYFAALSMVQAPEKRT